MQKIFVDKTNVYAFKKMLKSINENENNIIIVPDKFSLNSEQMFFEENNLSVSFSTQTYSLTKLASKILEKKLRTKKLIDKNISVMIISQIITEKKDEFLYFKNIRDFGKISEDIYNFISQVLSSEISSFNDNIPIELKNKISDINLVLNEYKKRIRTGLVDSSFKFELFLNEIKNSDLIKNSNFYFGMFDSLTNQVKSLIKEISKYAKSVSFSASVIENKVNNNQIFDFYKSLNKNCEIVKSNSLDDFSSFLSLNFFSSNNKKFEIKNDRLVLFETKNIDDEIDNLVYEIKKDVFLNNLRFKDIAVCLSDFNGYCEKLKVKFLKAKINIFVDENQKLISTGYARFLLLILNAFEFFDIQDALNILKSGYVEIELKKIENFESFAKKIKLQSLFETDKFKCFCDDELFEDFNFVFNNFVKLIFDFKNNIESESANEFFLKFDNLLDKLGSKKLLKQKIEDYKKTDILLYKKYCQLETKIDSCFESIKEFYNQKFDLKKLIYFVNLCFDNTTISLAPVSVDSVFVGDSENSEYKSYKKIYVLGANSNFPKLTPDNAIFCENELKMLEMEEEINPKPSLVNKISFYKCFEILLNSSQNLVLSYSAKSENSQNYPSIFVKNCLKHFVKDGKPINFLKINLDVLNTFDYNQILAVLSVKFQDIDDFVKNYYLQEDGKLKQVLNQVVTNKSNWSFETKNEEIDKNLIETNVFSSSSLEDYFGCSKRYFYRDILKLKPNDQIDFDARIVGNIVHSCCKKLADKIIKQTEIMEKDKKEIVDFVFAEKKYNFLKTTENGDSKIKNLKNEIFKLFDFVLDTQKQSEFKICKAEYGFLQNVDGVKFKGFVDRIDETNDEFIIVDYKTGKTKIDYCDIIVGTKIQLLLYAKILEQILNKKCMGVYYLSVSDEYSTQKKQKIYFNGITVNENNVINRLSKNETDFEFKEKYLLTRNQFDKLKNYVFEKITNAIKSIKNAEFFENPVCVNDFSCCEYCEFGEVCLQKNEKIIEFDENMIKEIFDD